MGPFWIIASLFLPLAAVAKDAPIVWKKEANPFFTCEIPRDWRDKPLFGKSPGYLLTDGILYLSATHFGPANPVYKDVADYIARRRREQGRVIPVSTVTVMGVSARQMVYTVETMAGGADVPSFPEWIREEIALVPDASGFWELELSETSRYPGFDSDPESAVWKRFLKTFRPLRTKP